MCPLITPSLFITWSTNWTILVSTHICATGARLPTQPVDHRLRAWESMSPLPSCWTWEHPRTVCWAPFSFPSTHDCKPSYKTNTIIKFADKTIIVGRITKNKESAYRAEVKNLESWSQNNNLILNATKTKEMILDLRRLKPSTHRPIDINGERVEVVQSFKYLEVHISQDAMWAVNTSVMVKRINFLRL